MLCPNHSKETCMADSYAVGIMDTMGLEHYRLIQKSMLTLLTCLSCVIISRVVAVATMAPLLPALSCRDRESPDTNCTPSSVTLTLSSTTRMLLSARTDDVRGDST
ncbi:hypothetical protein EYF80_018302 [Liparis tanakae]|uniref:Uncharacterized protein n=1 Tax=Liparis tanakae TaxID=230148 RepID=A0A4Z2I0Q0_9TELE|nr:hypothetical protein EYF80_018302 [Liparis tanakae]